MAKIISAIKTSLNSESEADQTVGGLDNLGNTCYMNSALQCLIATTTLRDFFLSGEFKKDLNKANPNGTKGVLAIEFAKLLQALNSRASISPREIKNVMDNFAPQFCGYAQHDAQEFLAFLLDGLHEDVNRSNQLCYIPEPDITKATLQQKTEERLAAEAWCRHLRRNRSFLVDLFQGQLKSSITCLRCHEVSVKFEPFMYLSLPIIHRDGKIVESLHEAVRTYLLPEELSGSNSWFCPACKCNVEAFKELDLWKMPPILIAQLKRFECIGAEFKKLKGFIGFPIESFDLSHYTKPRQKQSPVYNAYAIVDHSGRAQYGHYTATAWHVPSARWCVFDDDVVTPIEGTKVITENAYVIFFQRGESAQQRELTRRQTLHRPEDWPHLLRTTSINEIMQTMPPTKL